MNTQLQKYVNTLTLERQELLAAKFNELTEAVLPVIEKATSIIVSDESQTDLMKQAREGRLFLKNKRGEIEKTRKELKEQSLREGQAIDGVAKFLRDMIEPAEEHLEQQEKFAELQRVKRREELREKRAAELMEFVADPDMFDLGNMTEEQYQLLLSGQKAAIRAQREAEQKAAEEQAAKEKAEAEERERIRLENERLRKEAEAREAEIAKERAEQERKLEAERKAAKEEQDRLADIARKEAEAREKLEKEKRDEEKRKADELRAQKEAERKAARAPDKTKLLTLANEISAISMPEVKSEEAAVIIADVRSMLVKVSNHITDKVNKL